MLLFLSTNANAAIQVENIDLNKEPIYTFENVSVDVNIGSDENKSIVIQLLDNNVLREELTTDVNSSDGNKQYYQYSFVLQFVEGSHSIDCNVFDSNFNQLAWGHTTATVLANPLAIDTNLSLELIQQYVLPIARSLSECLVQKTDLNFTLTQAIATMKGLQNDVGIAEADKIEAENKLVEKRTELDSCNSAWATCKADKTVVESDLLNSQAKCENEKIVLKNEESDSCDYLLDLKEETVEQRDSRILDLTQSKLEMEAVAVLFGILFFAMVCIIAFLYYKNRIR